MLAIKRVKLFVGLCQAARISLWVPLQLTVVTMSPMLGCANANGRQLLVLSLIVHEDIIALRIKKPAPAPCKCPMCHCTRRRASKAGTRGTTFVFNARWTSSLSGAAYLHSWLICLAEVCLSDKGAATPAGIDQATTESWVLRSISSWAP